MSKWIYGKTRKSGCFNSALQFNTQLTDIFLHETMLDNVFEVLGMHRSRVAKSDAISIVRFQRPQTKLTVEKSCSYAYAG